MSFQSNSNALHEPWDEGEDATERTPRNMPNNNGSRLSPQQNQFPPDAIEDDLDVTSLTAGEHRIYDLLRAHGWGEKGCLFYFRNIKAMQEILVQYFRAKGWSEDQLEAFDDVCCSGLPEELSTPPGDNASDYEWQKKMIAEMNRRKRIGDNMDFSTSQSEMHDGEETHP